MSWRRQSKYVSSADAGLPCDVFAGAEAPIDEIRAISTALWLVVADVERLKQGGFWKLTRHGRSLGAWALIR